MPVHPPPPVQLAAGDPGAQGKPLLPASPDPRGQETAPEPHSSPSPDAGRRTPDAVPLAQATPIPDVIKHVTEPTPSPTPGGPSQPDPVFFRFESTPTNEFSSNVTQQISGQSDSVLKLPISASLGYRFPWGMQGVLGYQYQRWRYMRLKENNVSLHLGTMVLSQPLTGFANLYGGYQAIFKVADNGTGIKRFDHDLLLGLALYSVLGGDKLIYGGYQFDTLIAEVHATAFNGHSVNLGYKQALLPNLLLTGKYRFQHRQPAQSGVVATNLHTFGLELEYSPLSWLTATVRSDYSLNHFTGVPQRNFNFYLVGVSLNFGLDNRTFAPARPVGVPTPAPTFPPTAPPTPVPIIRPTPVPTPAPTVRPTPRPAPKVRPTIKKVPARATLRQLAQWYYGNENLWPVIARANKIRNPNLIGTSQRLIVPSLEQLRRPRVQPGRLPPGVLAVVTYRSGMHLGDLAWKYYRNDTRWREIARFNGITNLLAIPDRMQLLIPKLK